MTTSSDHQHSRGHWPDLRIFAFDHRSQFEEMPGATPDKIGAFKQLCLRAASAVANGRDGYGLLCDQRLGHAALDQATGGVIWVGRPVEWPGSRPLKLEPEVGDDFAGLGSWPKSQVVKCLCFCHPDDDAETWTAQENLIKALFLAAQHHQLQFLLEVIPSKVGPVDEDTTPKLIQRFYDLGVRPDWWKLEPFKTDLAWQNVCAAINRNDPDICGIVALGLGAPAEELFDSFALAARHDLVKGFAVGRTIFGDVARQWMLDGLNDSDAVEQMSENYRALCHTWDDARAQNKEQGT